MKTLRVNISETDAVKFGLSGDNLNFTELVSLIEKELSKENIIKSIELAEKYGLSGMTMEEITKEVKKSRFDAKNRH